MTQVAPRLCRLTCRGKWMPTPLQAARAFKPRSSCLATLPAFMSPPSAAERNATHTGRELRRSCLWRARAGLLLTQARCIPGKLEDDTIFFILVATRHASQLMDHTHTRKHTRRELSGLQSS